MKNDIQQIINYVKNNTQLPTCSEMQMTQEKLNRIIKKCNDEDLLDKKYIFVNILGEINCDDDPELAITMKGLKYLEENNPLGKVE